MARGRARTRDYDNEKVLELGEKFDKLRYCFWHDSWSEEETSEFLRAISRSGKTFEVVFASFASRDFRKKSDWIFDSFLIGFLARSKDRLNANQRNKLFKLLLREKNVVVSLECQEAQITPGTLTTKSRKKVLSGNWLPDVVEPLDERNLRYYHYASEFSLVQSFFANTRAFDFISPKIVVEALRKYLVLFDHFDIDEQARQRFSTLPVVFRSVNKLMAERPNEFCESLWNKDSPFHNHEDYFIQRLVKHIPRGDFTKKSGMWALKMFASFVRTALLKTVSFLNIPEKKDCLYEMFPNLVALLSAVQDIEMIRYLAETLNVAIGPFKWNSWDFSVRTVTFMEPKEEKAQITCFKSPITSAGYYRNTELIDLFSMSAKLSTMQLEQMSNPPEARKSQIWDHELQKHFDKARTEFWDDASYDSHIKFFSCLAKCNLTVEEVNRVLSEDVIKRESDWIFVSFLFWCLTRNNSSQNAFIVKALLGVKNMVASFGFVKINHIPGTLKKSCMMKVLGSRDNLDVFGGLARKEYNFSLFGELFNNVRVFSFVSHGEILDAFGKVIKRYPRHHEQIRETISTTILLKSSITTIMETEPSNFCEDLLKSSTKIYTDSVATEILEAKISPTLLLQNTFLWTHQLSAAIIRESMRRFECPLEVPAERTCLYRMFPELMALFVAVEDLRMIQYLAFAFNVPVGPFRWLPTDFLRVGSRCLLRSNETCFSYFKSPIITAGQYRNQEIIKELCRSSPLTVQQMDEISNPLQKMDNRIWEYNLQKVFMQSRKEFWKDIRRDHRIVESLLLCIPYNATVDELKEIFSTQSIRLKSDWAFISFLLYELDSETGASHQRLQEVFWEYPNTLATFDSIWCRKIPGTANSRGNMRVLNNEKNNILIVGYERPYRYKDPLPPTNLPFVSKYEVNPRSFILIEPEHVIQLLQLIFPTKSSNIALEDMKNKVLTTPLFEDKMKKFLDSTSLTFCDKLLWTGNFCDESLVSRIVHDMDLEVSLVKIKYVFACFIRVALLDLDVTPYLLEEDVQPQSNWRKRLKKLFWEGPSSLKEVQHNNRLVPNCLYRKFKRLVALLTEAQDIDMIQSIADYLRIPVGPFNWIPSYDCSALVVNKFSNDKIQFPSEPIVSAVVNENDELIKLFSLSCPFKPRHQNFVIAEIRFWLEGVRYYDGIDLEKLRNS